MKKVVVTAFAVWIHVGISFGQIATTSGTAVTSGTAKTDEDLVVITVNKNAQVASKVGSDYSKLSGNEIERSQYVDLKEPLNSTPGVLAAEIGAPGGFAEVQIRGCAPSQSLILVDGVRVNTGINQDANPFLTFAGTDNLNSLEIVRGPQSTLYGSDSIGGVVSLETKRGEGTPSVTVFGEAGSFSTFREGISSNGSVGKLDYSVSYERDDSENNRPNDSYGINRYSLRLDDRVLDNLTLTLSFRGVAGNSQYPGSINPLVYNNNDPGERQTGEGQLLSFITTWKVTDIWTQKLTLGAYFERSTEVDPAYAGNYYDANNWVFNAANYSADWQNIIKLSDKNRLTAGLAFTESTGDYYYNDNFYGLTQFQNKSFSNEAIYVQDEWEVVKNLNLTGGVRDDYYQQAGNALTYRLTGAYLFDKTDTKLRSSFGTAFQAPSLLELFSPNPYYLGNTNLSPQTSKGWDVGVDQYLLQRRVTLGLTYFQNHIKNLISVPEYQYENINTAHNDGVEFSALATLMGEWKSRFSYTWTETNVVTQFPQPRNKLSLDTNYRLFGKWLIGCGASYQTGAQVKEYYLDYSVQTVRLANYFTARIYSRYEVNDHLAVFVRGENITNAHYQTMAGFPALPIGIYGGVEVKF